LTSTVALPYGDLKWRVRVNYSGEWGPFSDYKDFYYQHPGFYSNFNSGSFGWEVVSGEWLITQNNYYTAFAPEYQWASISRWDLYKDVYFEAMMKREGSIYSPNALILRGTVEPLGDDGWNSEYSFLYSNAGYFSVYKIVDGVETSLTDDLWYYSDAINQNGWNKLTVASIGENLFFHINDTYVWGGTDSDLAEGTVGLEMYHSEYDASNTKILVDWAQSGLAYFATQEMMMGPNTSDQVGVPGGTIEHSPLPD